MRIRSMLDFRKEVVRGPHMSKINCGQQFDLSPISGIL